MHVYVCICTNVNMIFALESPALVIQNHFGLCLNFESIQKKKSRVTQRKRLKERSGKLEKLENQVSIWGTNIFFTKLQNFPRTIRIFNKAIILSYFENYSTKVGKVHIFWEGHKILRNLHQLFDWQYIGQIFGGDFAKFCGLLRTFLRKV